MKRSSSNGFMIIWHDVAAESEDEYDTWHTKEHMPERLSIPGFLRGRRGVDWPLNKHRYLTIYEGSSVDVFGSPAYLERLNNPSTWTSKIAPQVSNFIRGACQTIASAGTGIGGVCMTIRISTSSDQIDCLSSNANAIVQLLAAQGGIAAAHVGIAQLQVSGAQTTETKLRGNKREESFGGVVVIEGTSRPALMAIQEKIESILNVHGLAQTADSTAIYDISYVLTSSDLC